MTPWRRICCPVDFSPTSDAALAIAADLAARAGATLTVAHVRDVVAEPVDPDAAESAAREARVRLDAAAASVAGRGAIEVRTFLGAGEPGWELVKLLERGGFDVAVLGTHGRSGVERIVVGSVAAHVLRHGPCSVLVVPGPRAPGAS